MPDEMAVSEVRIRFNPTTGGSLIGWASCVLNGALHLDSMEIRRGQAGHLYLECPSLPSRKGITHPVFHPITRQARECLERAILEELERACATGGGHK